MREILTGIFSWPWFSEPHGYNFNGHFIRHSGVGRDQIFRHTILLRTYRDVRKAADPTVNKRPV